MNLKGVGGKLRIKAKGTMRISFYDNGGQLQTYHVHDAYYAPKLQITLLCPQQWVEQGPINKKGVYVRACHVSARHTTLHWPGGHKTVDHDPTT
ncbi:unnamed protein product [Cylindrotheca closterium]|uniref:Uncharacterized protein n=1 Tax=Cylindrotheca closterium TaxID=2856 RepID=A0AAD2JNV1_9STRA|nr:unnamed protein product [Cylindrotheca closterium]